MDFIWKLKSQCSDTEAKPLADLLNIDISLAKLLHQRNVKTFDEARAFFRPSLSDLHDPFLMKDMDKAVDRIVEAIETRQKILIYGDYDVDGTTSVALVYKYLKIRYDKIGYYIPNRYAEGYGISYKGIDYAAENDFKLVIALDCGVKAVEKVQYAKQKGVDFIICDHHTPGDKLPEAVALLVPKRADCPYPFKELSGCGVGFKLMHALVLRTEVVDKSINNLINGINNDLPCGLSYLLDLVCVSIASDIVPIIGENRVMAYYGLKLLKSKPCVGLKVLKQTAGIEEYKDITISDVVFKLGPRINAAGRIESGSQSVELLIADDEEQAKIICARIDSYNRERKDLDHFTTEEAVKMLNSGEEKNKKATILFNPNWHKGVVGIVASRLIEWYYRPTVIMTESGGLATGSARSVEGFDLYNAVNLCSDLLENFGGHKYAAGLTLKPENLEKFKERFERIVAENITQEQQLPQIEIDAKISFNEITPKFYRILKQFAPFGPENMNPVFMTEKVIDNNGNSRRVGKDSEHLKLELNDRGTVLPGIAFGKGSFYENFASDTAFDVCFNIDENEFRGNTSLQLFVRDIKKTRKS